MKLHLRIVFVMIAPKNVATVDSEKVLISDLPAVQTYNYTSTQYLHFNNPLLLLKSEGSVYFLSWILRRPYMRM